MELLAASCQQASARNLDSLAGLCFELAAEARWDEAPGRRAALEFELLKRPPARWTGPDKGEAVGGEGPQPVCLPYRFEPTDAHGGPPTRGALG
ncbi:uncharacterized protein STAUR_8381 [Stigmatella aurantiaca DW4/3-1]|uniref:Uncharacterized protein n=1 Tax=Stigmatella aurantiaca (strain DW4/3-1) TaxID=378806 RepID=E3FY06_STIAD|nr:uncharacterized protein STAUR_8381 [Stigmatella aurantiaca DW4/3-1]